MNKNTKKITSFLLLTLFLNNVCLASPLKGSVTQEGQLTNQEIFTGETDTLDSKDTVKMTVSQVISGNIHQEGDEFFAEITENVSGKKGIIIPKGSIVHGIIQQIEDPKKLNRNGYIVTVFDYIVTPDGRQIQIQGNLSTKENLAKGTVKNVAQHAGVTLVSGALGGLMSINIVGIESTIASYGMTAAIGAGAGGAIGLVSMLSKKGKIASIEPGDEFEIKIIDKVNLPVFSEKAFLQEELRVEGLDVDIYNAKYTKDPFGDDNFIVMNVKIQNYSDIDFYPFDIALIDDVKKIYYPSAFTDNGIWFSTIKSGEKVIGKLSFSVNDKKNKHWLIFMDRGTKKPLAKYSVEQFLSTNKDEKKNRKRLKNK